MVTGIVLAGTVGYTNMETPRLWIPFMPLLLIGLAAGVPMLRGAGQPGRWSNSKVRLLLAALVVIQVTAASVQWSLMDMRESEMRLSSDTPRYYN